jgi:hypothetical protein
MRRASHRRGTRWGWIALGVALAVVVSGAVVLSDGAPAQAESLLVYRSLAPTPVLAPTGAAKDKPVVATLPKLPKGAVGAWLSVRATNTSTKSASVFVCAGDHITDACAQKPVLVAAGHDVAATPLRLALPAGSTSRVTFSSTSPVMLSADVSGYFLRWDSHAKASKGSSEDSVYQPVPAHRLVTDLAVASGDVNSVTIPNVPSGSTAVAIGIRASGYTSAGTVSLCPVGQSSSTCASTSALSTSATGSRQSFSIVKLGGAKRDQVSLINAAGNGRLSLDLLGFFTSTQRTAVGGFFSIPDVPGAAKSLSLNKGGSASVAPGTLAKDTSAVLVKLTADSSDTDATVSVCARSTASGSCAEETGLVTSRTAETTNTVLVRLPITNKSPSLVVHSASGASHVRVQVLGEVVNRTLSASASPSASAAVGSAAPSPTWSPTEPAIITPTPSLPPTPGTKPSPTAKPSPKAKPAPGTTAPVPPKAPAQAAPPAPAPSPASSTPGGSGVPAGTALQVHNGDLTVTKANSVVNAMDIRGRIMIAANNVTIKNSIVRGRPVNGNTALISSNSPSFHFTVANSELFPSNPSAFINGIVGSNFTATQVNIHGVVDAIDITGDNVVIESSWLHGNLHYSNDPNHSDGSHDDSIQIQRGANIRITGNTISGAHNAALMITQDTGHVSNVQLSNNFIDGGSCSINVAQKSYGPIGGLSIVNNGFGRNTSIPGCSILIPKGMPVTTSGNYYADSQASVAVRPGA